MGFFTRGIYRDAIQSLVSNYQLMKKKHPELTRRDLYVKAISQRPGWNMVDYNLLDFKKSRVQINDTDKFKAIVKNVVTIELMPPKSDDATGKKRAEAMRDIVYCLNEVFENFKE